MSLMKKLYMKRVESLRTKDYDEERLFEKHLAAIIQEKKYDNKKKGELNATL